MQKFIVSLAAAAVLIAPFAGCAAKDAQNPSPSYTDEMQEAKGTAYAMLSDAKTQSEIASILIEHGVTAEQTDVFMQWVKDFNERVISPKLPEGFVSMKANPFAYDGLKLSIREKEDGSISSEANCRLSAFLLMRNMIETNGKNDETDTYLMFDVEAIDTEKQFQMSKEERSDFIALFNWVDVSDAKTLEQHIEKIKQSWSDRAITIREDAGLSLIEVYLDAPFDKVRFVGHTGVLAEVEDGLLFVEKYGPQAPFQATKFHDRSELRTYLLARPDLYGDETELPPIIMENGKVME